MTPRSFPIRWSIVPCGEGWAQGDLPLALVSDTCSKRRGHAHVSLGAPLGGGVSLPATHRVWRDAQLEYLKATAMK